MFPVSWPKEKQKELPPPPKQETPQNQKRIAGMVG